MINGDFNCFFETISAGMEAFLKYKNRKYLVQGWFNEDTRKQFFCVDDITHDWDASEIWSTESDSMEDNARTFLNAPIFDGKSFLEVEDEIEWVDE